MTEVVERQTSSPLAEVPPSLIPRRVRAAEWIAFLGLVAAFIGAIGPAKAAQTTYSWPPKPAVESSARLYAPLLLASRVPERIEVSVPCGLPRTRGTQTVVATARHPVRSEGLLVTRDAAGLSIQMGSTRFARVVRPLSSVPEPDCADVLVVEGSRWTLTTTQGGETRNGELRRMPFVNGLFTEAVAGPSSRPTVRITTRTHGVATSWQQTLAWLLAVACALTSLALVAVRRRKGWLGDLREGLRRVAASLHAVDVVVAAALLMWWVLAPAFFDDGWTIARQTAFGTTGNFSNYYESFGVGLPLGYWLEWLQHWVTRSTDALVLLRVPTLLCLAGVWLLCRWIFVQMQGPFRNWRSPAAWALAVGFVALVMAWGMSLRQEPAVALLTTGVMACSVRFLQTRSTTTIACAALLVPLALTAHPTGIIAFAPLVAVLFELARWARVKPAVAVAILTASGAFGLTLAFIGSDVGQRALDAQTVSTFSTTIVDWRSELSRYSVLTGGVSDFVGYSAPMRRAAVALIALACLAFLLRRNRERRELLDLPARALLLSLLLFVATPSKWPWHLGALIGFAALAVASETVRWRSTHPLSSTLARSAVAVICVTLAASWAWSPRGAWNAVDLVTLDWTPAFERLVPLGTAAALLPAMLIGAGVLARRIRQAPAADVPARVASWAAPILIVPIAVFTVVVLGVDTARTAEWTAARGNLAGLTGAGACGLAEDLRVPVLDSIDPLPRADPPAEARRPPNWIAASPSPELPRFALGPTLGSTTTTPWFAVTSSGATGWFVTGRPGAGDRLELQWATRRAGKDIMLRSRPIPVPPATAEAGSMPWQLLTPPVGVSPKGATMVRIALVNDSAPASAVAVTAPFHYSYEQLARTFAGSPATLVMPHVATFFPCLQLPRLRSGVVETPHLVVSTVNAQPLLLDPGTSPFNGMLDLYDIQRLPVVDSKGRKSDIAVYAVAQDIPGWQRIDAERVATTS